MLSKISIIIVSLWTMSTCAGQQLLFHNTRSKEAIYKVGDIMSFSTKGNDTKLTSQILGFEGDSLIVFQNYKINPREITTMYADDKTRGWYPLRYLIDNVLFIAGVGYPLLDVVNEVVLNGQKFDKGVLLIGGSLIGAGFLAKFLISDKIRIKGMRKLVIIDSG